MEMKVIVEGMQCNNCAKHVKEALINVQGITYAEVNVEDKSVVIRSNSFVSEEAIKAAINGEKYKVIEIKYETI